MDIAVWSSACVHAATPSEGSPPSSAVSKQTCPKPLPSTVTAACAPGARNNTPATINAADGLLIIAALLSIELEVSHFAADASMARPLANVGANQGLSVREALDFQAKKRYWRDFKIGPQKLYRNHFDVRIPVFATRDRR